MKALSIAVGLLGAAVVSAEPAPPELRLPDSVRPIRQSVDLTLDPEGESFTGTVEIDLDVRAALPLIWLNARELDIREATLILADGPVSARIVPGGDDFVGFALEGPTPTRSWIRWPSPAWATPWSTRGSSATGRGSWCSAGKSRRPRAAETG